MSPRPLLFIVVAALLAAAFQTASAQTPSVRDEWVKDWNAQNLKALLALYDKDAVLLPPVGQRITGRDEIENYFKQIINGSSKFTMTPINTEDLGKFAYDSGSLQYTVASGGAVMGGKSNAGGKFSMGGGGSRRVEGNYLMILKRAPEGKWLIVQHAWTEVAAAPAK